MNTRGLALKARIDLSDELVMTLSGRCMEPLLIQGDTALIISAKNIKVGTIYLLELDNGDIVLHRVIGLNKAEVLVKGDCASMYEVVPVCDVIGRLRAIRLLGQDTWQTVKDRGFPLWVCTALSRLSIHDKRYGDEGRWHRNWRMAIKKILHFQLQHMRKNWSD